MEIKKGCRYVCIENVDNIFTKGNVYNVGGTGEHIISEYGSYSPTAHGNYEKYFIPYSKLDRVYTKYTERLEKLFDAYEGNKKRTSGGSIIFFDNCQTDFSTGYFYASDAFDEYYTKNNFTYLSEQAFIEFMGLLPEQANYTSMSMYLKSDKSDAVNKPSHYNNGSIEPIDYITANSMNFLEGNVVKYVTRYKFKNGLEDLKKAEFYLKKLIEGYGKD